MRFRLQKEPRALPPAVSPNRLSPHRPLSDSAPKTPRPAPSALSLSAALRALSCLEQPATPCSEGVTLPKERGGLCPRLLGGPLLGPDPGGPICPWSWSLARPAPRRLPGRGWEPRGLTAAGRSGPRPPEDPGASRARPGGHRAATRCTATYRHSRVWCEQRCLQRRQQKRDRCEWTAATCLRQTYR